MSKNERVTIYVAVLDEGLDVWRPVAAQRLSPDRYMILGQDYDRDSERWQFEPGAAVRCEGQERADATHLVAIEADAAGKPQFTDAD